ncbi:MAG: hypothetical protein DBX45_09030 [Oscillospiraceae bacterium]|nr:MAG: hypothetical protein DBX45_09030 [Oscillospiraceae bacterium]
MPDGRKSNGVGCDTFVSRRLIGRLRCTLRIPLLRSNQSGLSLSAQSEKHNVRGPYNFVGD